MEWGILYNTMSIHECHSAGDLVRALGAIINWGFPPLRVDTAKRLSFARRITRHLATNQTTDNAKRKCGSAGWSNKVNKPSTRGTIATTLEKMTFIPRFGLDDVETLAMGTYGISLAKKYILRSYKDLSLMTSKRHKKSLKIMSLRSRFSASKKHKLILDFSARASRGDPLDKLKWWCDCKSGARTISPCAHVISILLLIRYARLGGVDWGLETKHDKKLTAAIIDCSKYKEWALKNETWCVCNKKYDENKAMILCSGCYDWFHPECVDMTEDEMNTIGSKEKYFCPGCEEMDVEYGDDIIDGEDGMMMDDDDNNDDNDDDDDSSSDGSESESDMVRGRGRRRIKPSRARGPKRKRRRG